MAFTLPNTLPAPFQIGIRPLDPMDWIEVDTALPAYLDEKARLETAAFAQIFMAEPDTEAAQNEVLAQLAAHLVDRFPAIYRRDGTTIAIAPAGRSVHVADPSDNSVVL